MKKKHRLVLRLLVFCWMFLFCVDTVFALSLQLKSVILTMDPMVTAMQRCDNNGNIGALVKVIIPGDNVIFEGNVIGKCEFKTCEYWCYLSPNTRFLKIKYPDMEPLMVDFHEHIGMGVQSRRIYEIHIVVPSKARSTGIPIKLNIEKQQDFCYPPLIEECQMRKALIKLDSIDIYVNLNNGIFDSHIKVSENFNDILLGDIHVGDIITIIPSESYRIKRIIVEDSVVTNQILNTKLYRKGAPIKGIFIDANTEMPIPDVSIDLYWLNPRGSAAASYRWLYSKEEEELIYEQAKTDSEGKYEIRNCFYKYIYNVQYSAPGYKCPSFDVIPLSDTITYIQKLAPVALDVIVTDGKKPLKGVAIYCDNIYNKTFYTDEWGKATIMGIINKFFIIKLEGFKTLEILYYCEGEYNIKMKRGNSSTIKKVECDCYKKRCL